MVSSSSRGVGGVPATGYPPHRQQTHHRAAARQAEQQPAHGPLPEPADPAAADPQLNASQHGVLQGDGRVDLVISNPRDELGQAVGDQRALGGGHQEGRGRRGPAVGDRPSQGLRGQPPAQRLPLHGNESPGLAVAGRRRKAGRLDHRLQHLAGHRTGQEAAHAAPSPHETHERAFVLGPPPSSRRPRRGVPANHGRPPAAPFGRRVAERQNSGGSRRTSGRFASGRRCPARG